MPENEQIIGFSKGSRHFSNTSYALIDELQVLISGYWSATWIQKHIHPGIEATLLEEIPRIDMQPHLDRVMNNKTQLVKLLVELKRDYALATDDIRNTFAQEEPERPRKNNTSNKWSCRQHSIGAQQAY